MKEIMKVLDNKTGRLFSVIYIGYTAPEFNFLCIDPKTKEFVKKWPQEVKYHSGLNISNVKLNTVKIMG